MSLVAEGIKIWTLFVSGKLHVRLSGMKRLIIGVTGATGTIYGWRLMEMLRSEGETEIHLVMSQSAKLTLKMEHDVDPEYIYSLAHEVHQPSNIGASISSGSFHSEGMVVAPCSIKTMSNIAMGN
ncbi:MAG: flavoprotein, partial [Rhodospirillaceae bacterium]